MIEQKFAHLQLICKPSTLVLERVLQASRYRGFRLVNLNYEQKSETQLEINLVVKGQAKLTTLQKTLEGIIEVEQCYLSDDQAKLAPLVEMGQHTSPELNNSAQQA